MQTILLKGGEKGAKGRSVAISTTGEALVVGSSGGRCYIPWLDEFGDDGTIQKEKSFAFKVTTHADWCKCVFVWSSDVF